MNMMDQRSQFTDLSPVLRPRSVAVVGASEQAGNLGGVAVSLMRKFGFAGNVYPINPKYETVHGYRCFSSVSDLPEQPDLAIIATSANLAEEIVRDCAAVGIRHGVIWAGGYSEVGQEGARLQDTLVATCCETGFTLVGPNCIGVINTRTAMVASFASFLVEADRLIPGDIAMISQSGGLATMAQALAQTKGIGFGLTVSVGNEAMLTVSDYIHAIAEDDQIRVIAAYVEGVRDGPRFVEAVTRARKVGKPVVVLKGGLTAASAQAAAAHTGAFSGERRVWEAVARELGIISAHSLEELLDLVLFLSRTDHAKLPRGNRVGIVTFGGGSGVMAADQCDAHGLALPPLSAETRATLKPLVPPFASVQNPVDLTPQTFNQEKWFATFPEALNTIASDPAIDIVFCQFGPQAQRAVETAEIVAALRGRTDKTVCLAWPLAPKGVPEVLEARGVYVFQEYERAIAALAKLADHATARRAYCDPVEPLARAFDWQRFVPDPKAGTVVSEDRCHRILAEAGVTVARGRLVRNADELEAATAEIGFPLVAKGISEQVTHRAAAGLVALDIRNLDELHAAHVRLTERAKRDGVVLDGIYLQEMVGKGLEIIVSAFRDPVFGSMVSCGSGGILTEIMEDVKLARTPLDVAGAHALLEGLRIISAARKLAPGADLDRLAEFVAHFSQIAHSAPWKRFVIELNPVKWSGDGVKAIDGLLIVDHP